MKKNILNTLLIVSSLFFLSGCKNAMDEHLEVTNVDNTVNLSEKIGSQANLSKFNSFLKSTGYDLILANSQSYTVWAPTDAALASLDASISSDPAKLKDFVANHISLTTIAASKGVTDTIKVNLQNGKVATVVGANFEEAAIVGQGQFVKNGALYTIDKAVATKLNVWDYLITSTDSPLQTSYISSLTGLVIDSAKATIIGYNTNGTPIFAPNPPMVSRNTYWSTVADLRTENQQFTYFMIQDAGYTAEAAKLTSYYPNFTQSALVKDLAVRGLYTADKLPDTLISTRGVKIPINKAAIQKSYRASNGIVYVVNALPFRLKDKVPVFKIEGERPFSFRSDRTGNTLYRTKLDDKGVLYKDIEVYNHGVSDYYVNYIYSQLPVVKYKVYARVIMGAAGDSQVANFTQRYFIYNPTTLVYDLFATQAVTPLNYTEILLGEYTPQQLGLLQLRLQSAASTSQNVNTLILDYLKFEPILP
ncbi:fasciclin domain-containing protein [Pedobacter frigiditerrae]|uniref:fasciclin domain-containing protein n=1 Tax=Pedobacter frigiditerrae TaxID=2530452 RepID=UPI0029318423|nr:fasciclin domain-containing protein [Pedobacter frigiditerrae]